MPHGFMKLWLCAARAQLTDVRHAHNLQTNGLGPGMQPRGLGAEPHGIEAQFTREPDFREQNTVCLERNLYVILGRVAQSSILVAHEILSRSASITDLRFSLFALTWAQNANSSHAFEPRAATVEHRSPHPHRTQGSGGRCLRKSDFMKPKRKATPHFIHSPRGRNGQ